jgi:hypothetical protein
MANENWYPVTWFSTYPDELIERLKPLEHPVNILELSPDEEIELGFDRIELYRTDIVPRYIGAPASKRILAIRGWLRSPYRYRGLPYVDITAGKLVSQILGLVNNIDIKKAIVKIKKIGEPPRAEFSVSFYIPA